MDEDEFEARADDTLTRLERAFEACDLDYEVKPGGVIEIEFDDGSKIIVNRHGAAREIWVAARAGGFHFKWSDGRWVSGRDGNELYATLSRLIGEQGGQAVDLNP